MPKRYVLVVAMFLLTTLLYVDRVCISVAKDDVRNAQGEVVRTGITSDLGLTDVQFGWILSAFALGYALFQTPGGYLADKLGARRVLAAIVCLWSLFTGLTSAAWNTTSMLAVRFLFGAGEAGAFPGIARATFSWIPMQERGIVQGINFSGSRLGAAFAMPAIAFLVAFCGWRASFVVLMAVGFAWAVMWYFCFRDEPTEDKDISEEELQYILENRQQTTPSKTDAEDAPKATIGLLARTSNVWLLSLQYFCSNFTFFFCLTWLFPHIKGKFGLTTGEAGLYTALPFIGGAIGCWISGIVIDRIYRAGNWTMSRRVPAIIGFLLASGGLTWSLFAGDVNMTILAFTIAILGADMTLAPSWATCIDIGKKHAGVVSGTMNMMGNLGSFVTGIAFAYLTFWALIYQVMNGMLDETKTAELVAAGKLTEAAASGDVVLSQPVHDFIGTLMQWGAGEVAAPFFILAAVLNALAVVVWLMINPKKSMEAA